MTTPATDHVVFTLEGQPKVPPIPTARADERQPAEGQPAALPAPVFGPEFGGEFKLRWPTMDDDVRIGTTTTAYFLQQGIDDPGAVPALTYQLAAAFTFFETLAIEKPKWFDRRARSTSAARLAVLRAHQVALALLEAEKKSSEDGGGA